VVFIPHSVLSIVVLIKLSRIELYNVQQELEPNARAMLMQTTNRPLKIREARYLEKLLKLLKGHPIHGRVAHLTRKAKKAKLNSADMIQLRAMAGNGEPGEGKTDVDGDVEIHDVRRTDGKTALPLLQLMIHDLGAQAENSSAVLKMIQKHAKEGINV
jgi:hypothetical protein